MIGSRQVVLAALALALASGAGAQSGRQRRVTTPAGPPAAAEPAPAPATPPDPGEAAPSGAPGGTPGGAEQPPQPVNARYGARYEGGSLSLKDGAKVQLGVTKDKLTIKSGGTDVAVVTSSVKHITYAQQSRKRTAEGVGVGSVQPIAGAILRGTTTTKHYVEIVWEGTAPGGIVLRVDKNDYRGLLRALQAVTGVEPRHEVTPINDWP